MILLLYIAGIVFNFVLLFDYLREMLKKEFDRYACLVYLLSVLASWLIWVFIPIRAVVRKIWFKM